MATLKQWKSKIKAENPKLTRVVDGVSIELNSKEYNDTINEWAQARLDNEVEEKIESDGGKHPRYAKFRKKAYGSIGDQLDMLYHDMAADKGDKTGDWFSAVKKVKNDNPKG